MKTLLLFSMMLMTAFFQTACANKIKEAARDVKYSAYESIGIEKRDLFKSQVKDVKENQDDSKEEFADALTQLKKVYGFDGGNLEREYNQLKDSYDDAKESATEVNQSVQKLETIAGDLFREWDKEIEQITSADLKARSRDQNQATRKKYNAYITQLKKSQSKMSPVLTRFNDQVLFLKHNLNAAAISGLKNESVRIEGDINRLIEDMNQSISQADELIKTL